MSGKALLEERKEGRRSEGFCGWGWLQRRRWPPPRRAAAAAGGRLAGGGFGGRSGSPLPSPGSDAEGYAEGSQLF